MNEEDEDGLYFLEIDSISSPANSDLLNDPRWREASCKGMDTNLWFPTDLADAQQAVKICNSCPVKDLCFDYALENHEYGIWGGHAFGGIKIGGVAGVPLGRLISAVCRAGTKICRFCRLINNSEPEDYPLFQRKQHEKRDQLVHELYRQGWSVNQIVNRVSLSQRQVYRILEKGERAA